VLHLKAGSALDEECRHGGPGIVNPIHLAVDQDHVRALGADHEPLLAGQVEGIPLAAGAGSGGEKIGATARLGQSFGSTQFATDHRLEEAFLLLVCAKDMDGFPDNGDQRVQAGERGAQHADFFQRHEF